MADDTSRQQLPGWKVRELAGARRALAESRAADRGGIEQVLSVQNAERDRTAAREDQAIRNARYCAGHDLMQEHQQRTGQTRRR